METDQGKFRANWYVIKRGIVGGEVLAGLHDHALARSRDETIALGDAQVANAPVVYGDPRFDALLEGIRDAVERATGYELWPTYSYLRLYRRGNALAAHRDRPSCEISMTLNIGMCAEHPWPLWIAGPAGIAAVTLAPGDGLIYRGCDCYHWRDPFDGDHLAQIFLHYVDRNGSNAGWKYDRRSALSCSA